MTYFVKNLLKKSAGLQIFVAQSAPRRAGNHGWFPAKNLQDCRFLSHKVRPKGLETMDGFQPNAHLFKEQPTCCCRIYYCVVCSDCLISF
jgi:hypothetical protein